MDQRQLRPTSKNRRTICAIAYAQSRTTSSVRARPARNLKSFAFVIVAVSRRWPFTRTSNSETSSPHQEVIASGSPRTSTTHSQRWTNSRTRYLERAVIVRLYGACCIGRVRLVAISGRSAFICDSETRGKASFSTTGQLGTVIAKEASEQEG